MTHKKEINRWAKQPDGTKVWQRMGLDHWTRIISPSWHPSEIYIVDDKYAELRMLEIDGAVIQSRLSSQSEYGSCYNKEVEWNENFENLYDVPVEFYRVKPKEPIHEYKWLVKECDSEKNYITGRYLTYGEAENLTNKKDYEYFIRIDKTMRERV